MIDIAKALLSIIKSEGIVLEDEKDVYNSLDKAITEGRFLFIENNGINIGFFTWNVRSDKSIFFNNLLIFKKYRGTISIRKYFKKIFSVYGAYTWRSRKHQRDVTIRKGTQ